MSETRRPGFWKRFWRAFIRLLAIVAFLAILGSAAIGGYVGFQELQRSFAAITARMDANERTVALIRSDVNNIMEENPEKQSRQVDILNENLASLNQRVANLQEVVSSDLLSQQAALDTLSDDVTTMTNNSTALAEDIAALNSGLTALQGDINENGRQIDDLGGELDSLQTNVAVLDAAVITLGTEQAVIMEKEAAFGEIDLPQTLGLFRVWELITRARLRLLENNVGLATQDIETAVRTIDTLVAADPESEGLKMVQARLALAFVSLPDNPTTAATDLEAAWDELDIIFAEEIFVDIETTPGEEAAPAATPEATVTPSP